MKFKKVVEFSLLLSFVILTRIVDVIGTYHYTPNLSAELNPMVVLFGFGWKFIIIVQIIGIIFSACINYISLFLLKPKPVKIAYLSFKEFISILHNKKTANLNWFSVLINNPNGKNESIYMWGWVIPRMLIYVGCVLSIFHFLLAFVPVYHQFHKFFIIPMYILMFSSMPTCIYFYLRFRYNEYKKQLD